MRGRARWGARVRASDTCAMARVHVLSATRDGARVVDEEGDDAAIAGAHGREEAELEVGLQR